METDVRLKVLFGKYPHDLLRLTHDETASVLSVDVVELQDFKRRVDCLLKLQRDGEVYYRHIEFQSDPDPEMLARCFNYNTQLVLHLKAPVLTTVVYLFPPGPRERSLAYRVLLGGKEVNVWRFDEVRLWEMSAAEVLAHGAPGLLALVPLMAGGESLEVIERAAAAIEDGLPEERSPDARAILLYLAGAHYNAEVLTRLLGREKMIQSSVWQAALAEGKEEGRAEGLRAEREVCVELIRKRHPALLAKAIPVVEACADHTKLGAWILSAGDLDDASFASLLGID
jgi:predicted transposase YdaD